MSAPATSRLGLPGRVLGGELRDRQQFPGRTAVAITKPRVHWAVVFLFATWVMPFVIYVGPVRLSPYRIALLLLFVPCLVWLAQARAGRIRLPDVLLGLYTFWCVASLTAVHGIAIALQTGGVHVLETVTPYLIARCCIRDADDFRALARLLTGIVLVLLPFALYEAVTGHNLYLDLSSRIFPSIGLVDKEPRWNLRRAQLFFEHPILMGVCLGGVLAMTHMVVGRETTFSRRWLRSLMVGLTGALSLSTGPLSGLLVQGMLMGWNWVFGWLRARWTILISLILLFVSAVELFANRPLPNFLVSFAFNPDSAYFRILIWNYGTQSVAEHPWFGVGLGNWERPPWMSSSIDMFWLYHAIVFGIPGAVLMLAFFLASVISVSLIRNLDQRHYDYRAAYLITMASFFLTGWMVHFWSGTYVFFLFMVGAGMWLSDVPEGAAVPSVRPVRSVARRQRSPVEGLLEQQPQPVDQQPRSGTSIARNPGSGRQPRLRRG